MCCDFLEEKSNPKTLDQVVDDLFGVDPDELDYTTANYQADFIAAIEDSADEGTDDGEENQTGNEE